MTANPNWFSQGVVLNPTLGQLLADTGPLVTGTYRLEVCAGSTGAGAIRVQWRNATNDANVFEHVVPVPAGGPEYCFDFDMITDTDNERLRVVAFGAITGSCQVSIMNKA